MERRNIYTRNLYVPTLAERIAIIYRKNQPRNAVTCKNQQRAFLPVGLDGNEPFTKRRPKIVVFFKTTVAETVAF